MIESKIVFQAFNIGVTLSSMLTIDASEINSSSNNIYKFPIKLSLLASPTTLDMSITTIRV